MQLTEMTERQHIFLSPHLDDVVLSCGGTLAHLAELGARRRVITIFAGTPAPDTLFSAFATHQHTMWGTPQQAYHTRRDEDTAALGYFGLAAIWLDYFDCIYRGEPGSGHWYYHSDDDIFGAVHPADLDAVRPIVDSIRTALTLSQETSQITFYAPLTVGGHVDHQLTFLVALQFLAEGYEVQFYEEYPYADRDPVYVDRALNETALALMSRTWPEEYVSSAQCWQNRIEYLSQDALELKIKAIAAYQTQLEVLFGGLEAMTHRMRSYALQVGQSKPAERFWILNRCETDD